MGTRKNEVREEDVLPRSFLRPYYFQAPATQAIVKFAFIQTNTRPQSINTLLILLVYMENILIKHHSFITISRNLYSDNSSTVDSVEGNVKRKQ